MAELTIDDLREIMRDCAGEDESVDLNGDIADVRFDELGYDSLALLEAAGQIQRKYGVKLDDEVVVEADTPAALVSLVNASLSAKV
uniref:Acyl carrier protein n=1 Tax=uncultured bacterium esnapd17 TaxID=1366598 RepID=S5TN64_9BACT|nr:acyl carrier protein [uncultured bacterium esnapd17]